MLKAAVNHDVTLSVQVSDAQISRSLEALPGGCHESLAGDLARILSALPEVRSDIVAEVRARLDAGAAPTPADLAARIIGAA